MEFEDMVLGLLGLRRCCVGSLRHRFTRHVQKV